VLTLIKKFLNIDKSASMPLKVSILFCYDAFFKPEMREELNRVLIPIVEYVDKNPGIPVNFKLSGATLSGLLWHNYKFVEKMISLVASGKIELLGSSFSNCALTFLDREIASEQVAGHKHYIKQVFDHLPKGFVFAHDCFSKELLSVIGEYNYKYFILQDRYLNQSAVNSLVESFDKKSRVNEEAISRLVYIPKKIISEGSDFFAFSEFCEFGEYFKKVLDENNESIFYKFVQSAFKSFANFDRNSLVTLKFDLSDISNISLKPLFDLGKVSEIILNFMQFLLENKYFQSVTYEKWHDENHNRTDNDNSQVIDPAGIKRSCGYRTPDHYEKASASAAFKKRLEAVHSYAQKLADSKKLCASLLRADREKISYNPIIELSKMTAMLYQHSFGCPAELDSKMSLVDSLAEARTHLNCLNELRANSKGVYTLDVNSDGSEKVIIVNDKIFVMLNETGSINNFIELVRGYEYIGGGVSRQLNRLNDMYDFKSGEDYYSIDSHDEETRIEYSYQPSHSVLVGAQFSYKYASFEVVKGMSLFNNKFVTRYNIKNTSSTPFQMSWKVKFSFSPDYLSVLKFGRPLLVFFTQDKTIEPDREYKGLEDGIGVANKLSDSYIYINTLRIVPDSIKTMTMQHAYGLILSYTLAFQPLEEKHFILDIGF